MNNTEKWTEECLRVLRLLSREASWCTPDDVAKRCPASRRMFALSQDAFAALGMLESEQADEQHQTMHGSVKEVEERPDDFGIERKVTAKLLLENGSEISVPIKGSHIRAGDAIEISIRVTRNEVPQ